MHCAPITQSKVSFCPHLSPCVLLHLSPPPFPLASIYSFFPIQGARYTLHNLAKHNKFLLSCQVKILIFFPLTELLSELFHWYTFPYLANKLRSHWLNVIFSSFSLNTDTCTYQCWQLVGIPICYEAEVQRDMQPSILKILLSSQKHVNNIIYYVLQWF